MRALLVGSDVSNISVMGALLNRRGLSVDIELTRKAATRRLEREIFDLAIIFGDDSNEVGEGWPPFLRGGPGMASTHFVVIESDSKNHHAKPSSMAEADVFSGPVCGTLINVILAKALDRLSLKSHS